MCGWEFRLFSITNVHLYANAIYCVLYVWDEEQSIVADMPHSNQSESIAHQFDFYGCESLFISLQLIYKGKFLYMYKHCSCFVYSLLLLLLFLWFDVSRSNCMEYFIELCIVWRLLLAALTVVGFHLRSF